MLEGETSADSGALWAAVPLTLAAAAAFGAAAVLQFRATRQVPELPAARLNLLMWLIRRPGWRWSVVIATTGLGLQVVALSLAPLTMVQPLVVTSLLWYVLLFALAERVRPDRAIMAEAILCLLGLSAFLLLTDPRGGQRAGLDEGWAGALLGISVAVSISLCLAAAAALGRRWRPLPLALAAGICFGVTAGLISSLTFHFERSPMAVLEHWQVYAIAVLGPFGLLLSQNAYQAGPLGAPAFATIIVTDPLVSIGVGRLWLGEQGRTGPWEVAGQVLALAVLIIAVFLLARRAPHVQAAEADRARRAA